MNSSAFFAAHEGRKYMQKEVVSYRGRNRVKTTIVIAVRLRALGAHRRDLAARDA